MKINRSKKDDQIEQDIGQFFQNKTVALPVLLGGGGYALYFWGGAWLAPIGSLVVGIGLAVVSWVLWALGVFAALVIARYVWAIHYNRKRFRYLQILPNAEDEITPAKLSDFMRRVHGSKRGQWKRFVFGKEWFSFLIHYRKHPTRGGQYVFYVGAPIDRLGAVEQHMAALYPRAEFYPVDSVDLPDRHAKSGRMKMRRNGEGSTLSLARFKTDQLPGILKVMKEGSWIQLNFSADSEWRLKRRIIQAEKSVKEGKGYRERSAFDVEEEKSFKKRFYGNEVSFHVTLSVAAKGKGAHGIRQKVATALASSMHDVNELRFKRLPGMVGAIPLPYPYRMVWTGSELANLFHLPVLTNDGLAEEVAARIPHSAKGTQRLAKGTLSSTTGINFGELVHPLIDKRQVKLNAQALSKHWVLTGVTGSGKSTVLNTIFQSFIEAKIQNNQASGFSFIDPKKETATIALNQLLLKEQQGETVDWSKVHWISFKGAENPPAMNLLYRMPGVEDNVLTDQIMRIIRENNPNVAAQAERLLKKCIQTLLADKETEHTILGIQPLLLRENFRRNIMARLQKDPANVDLIEFWKYEAPELIPTSAQAIFNRLDIFYSNPFMRRIFGQTSFNFPIRKWMDEGHMVFYDFSGMGEEEIGLIGGYLAYLHYRVADTRPDGSMLHQFVIDEAQRVKASILPEIQKEMRSKGLSLGISTQTLDSLEPELRGSSLNVVSNMFVCKQGESGSVIAAKAFKAPGRSGKDVLLFSESYFKQLAVRNCVIKTEDNGKTVYAVVNVPPLDRYLPNGQVAEYGESAKAKQEIAASNKWTYEKAKELESKNGLPYRDIDLAIRAYLNEEVPERSKLTEPRKEVILTKPEKPVNERKKLLGG